LPPELARGAGCEGKAGTPESFQQEWLCPPCLECNWVVCIQTLKYIHLLAPLLLKENLQIWKDLCTNNCIAMLLSKVRDWTQPKYSTMGTAVGPLGNMMCLLHDILEESLPA